MRTVTWKDLTAPEQRAILHRSAVPNDDVRDAAARICAAIRDGGDAALNDAGRRYGGSRIPVRVAAEEITAAARGLPAMVTRALEAAIDAVTRFHRAQLPADHSVATFEGVRIERKWTPLASVGAYVPGGKATYPSSLIMAMAPAAVAAVGRRVVATPADQHGRLSPVLLGAAHLAGVDELYAMGGAQAIAGLAYGTETIQPVDKIVGPGNPWVTAAKLAVYGVCDIDLPAGPSEVLVIADHTAEPRLVAIDLLCQAEHGPDSPAVLVTSHPELADRVAAELDTLLAGLERRDLLIQALDNHGLVVLVDDTSEAVDFANEYAGEHVTVMTEAAADVAKAVTGAGSVYVGRWSPESAGDYATGANHVLPTGGLARACGPLAVDDFGSWRQVQTISERGLARLRGTICTLAEAEGLTAHALAATLRFEQGDDA